MKVALGLDLGTTTTTAIALREDGSVAAAVTRPNDAAVSGLPAGHAEQDPLRIRDTALEMLTELAAKTDGSVRCLGLTGQMHGGLLIDRDGHPLTRLITWQDRRATVRNGDGPSPLEEFRSRVRTDEMSSTGCEPAAGYLGVTLFCLQRENQIPPDAHRAVMLADWIAGELTARLPQTDRSNAASTGLFDLRNDRWSEPLIAAAGFDGSMLPMVRESGEVLGDLAPETAERTGLPAGLPVCNAIGDNQAAVLGSVPAGEQAVQINIGTGGQINWPVAEFVRVDGMDTRYLPLGRFFLVGAGVAGGAAFAWLNETVIEWLRAFAIDIDREDVYRRMNDLAASVPDDADGLICEPYFRGTRRHPEARGIFRGIAESNFTPGHISRAILNGIAAALHQFYQQAGDQRPAEMTRIIGSGNGLRKNRLLVETLARMFERDVWLPEHREEAACGAALLAGVQTGIWPDFEAAGACIRLKPANA